jgi:hypothetical protein
MKHRSPLTHRGRENRRGRKAFKMAMRRYEKLGADYYRALRRLDALAAAPRSGWTPRVTDVPRGAPRAGGMLSPDLADAVAHLAQGMRPLRLGPDASLFMGQQYWITIGPDGRETGTWFREATRRAAEGGCWLHVAPAESPGRILGTVRFVESVILTGDEAKDDAAYTEAMKTANWDPAPGVIGWDLASGPDETHYLRHTTQAPEHDPATLTPEAMRAAIATIAGVLLVSPHYLPIAPVRVFYHRAAARAAMPRCPLCTKRLENCYCEVPGVATRTLDEIPPLKD